MLPGRCGRSRLLPVRQSSELIRRGQASSGIASFAAEASEPIGSITNELACSKTMASKHRRAAPHKYASASDISKHHLAIPLYVGLKTLVFKYGRFACMTCPFYGTVCVPGAETSGRCPPRLSGMARVGSTSRARRPPKSTPPSRARKSAMRFSTSGRKCRIRP